MVICGKRIIIISGSNSTRGHCIILNFRCLNDQSTTTTTTTTSATATTGQSRIRYKDLIKRQTACMSTRTCPKQVLLLKGEQVQLRTRSLYY